MSKPTLAELKRENAELRLRLELLEARLNPVGLEGATKTHEIQVGGQTVTLRAMPPSEWVKALEEIPSFLLAYAAGKAGKTSSDTQQLEEMYVAAKRWVEVCAVGEVNLETLTVPEAQHAAVVIAQMNGLDAHLARFFREKLGLAAVGPSGLTVRPTA